MNCVHDYSFCWLCRGRTNENSISALEGSAEKNLSLPISEDLGGSSSSDVMETDTKGGPIRYGIAIINVN